MQTLYEEYATLTAQENFIANRKDELKAQILGEMNAKGENKIETGLGSFSIAKLKKWTYPEKVLEVGEKFKAMKAKAESTGDATYIETDSLRFTQAKL